MLTHGELVALERALRNETVLSVYVNGVSTDPAKRDRWSIDLRHSLDDIESWLRESSHEERERFAACRKIALEQLSGFLLNEGARGWVGFFTAKGPYHMGVVPVAVPTMAVWSTGASVAPYIRALKENRPVIVAVVDSSEARLYRYADGEVARVETVERKLITEEPSHMGSPPRAGFHGGTRGRAGTDVAQREEQTGTDRMLAAVGSRIAGLAGDAWIVVGGIPTVAAAAMAHFTPELAARAVRAEHLDVHASDAQVAECARASASQSRNAEVLRRLDDVVAAAESGGAGTVGAVDTERALVSAQVRDLLITQRYLENQAAAAEMAVRRAFDVGATVEFASGDAAVRLDAIGGIAARLRYAPPRMTAMQTAAESPDLPV